MKAEQAEEILKDAHQSEAAHRDDGDEAQSLRTVVNNVQDQGRCILELLEKRRLEEDGWAL